MSTTYEITTTQSNPCYTQNVRLDGATYQMQMRYNPRMDRWVMSLYAADGSAIVQGVAVLAQRDLVGQYAGQPIPPGTLYCASSQADGTQPGLASFLLDFGLYYQSAYA